jgi:hypothetical protein
MSKHRNLVAATLAMGLMGLFSLLLHLQTFRSPRPVPETFPEGFRMRSEPQYPIMNEDPPSYTTFKVPGEVDGFPPHIWQTTGPSQSQKSNQATLLHGAKNTRSSPSL